jgi:hypothetical protein
VGCNLLAGGFVAGHAVGGDVVNLAIARGPGNRGDTVHITWPDRRVDVVHSQVGSSTLLYFLDRR